MLRGPQHERLVPSFEASSMIWGQPPGTPKRFPEGKCIESLRPVALALFDREGAPAFLVYRLGNGESLEPTRKSLFIQSRRAYGNRTKATNSWDQCAAMGRTRYWLGGNSGRNVPTGVSRHIRAGAAQARNGLPWRGDEVFGLDAAPNLVEIARARVPGGEFHLGDLESLPFPDKKLIWSPDLIHFNMPGILGADTVIRWSKRSPADTGI